MRAHYEKVICACCLLLLFTNVGLASTSFNVYQPHIVAIVGDENGSNVLLLRTLVSLLCMMVVGRWYDLLNCRLGASLACCLSSVGFFAYSLASDMPGFLCGATLTGAGYGLGGMVASTLLINRWYKASVGTALGIVAAGSSIAGIIMPVVTTFFIGTLGLDWSFRFEAALALAMAVVCFTLLRNSPAEMGLKPFGDDQPQGSGSGAMAKSPSQKTPSKRNYGGARQPLSTRRRLLMCMAMMFMGCVAVDSWNYLSVLMTHAGFDHVFAATLLSIAAIAMLVGKLAIGKLFDRIGTLSVSILFFTILFAGLALCALADLGSTALMIAGVLLLGFGVSLGSVGISVWSIELSTPVERPKLIKNLQVAYACGGFLFNLLPGRIVEAGGSYTTSYAILAILCIAEAAIVISTCRNAAAE